MFCKEPVQGAVSVPSLSEVSQMRQAICSGFGAGCPNNSEGQKSLRQLNLYEHHRRQHKHGRGAGAGEREAGGALPAPSG